MSGRLGATSQSSSWIEAGGDGLIGADAGPPPSIIDVFGGAGANENVQKEGQNARSMQQKAKGDLDLAQPAAEPSPIASNGRTVNSRSSRRSI